MYVACGLGVFWVTRKPILRTINNSSKVKNSNEEERSAIPVDVFSVEETPIRRTLVFAGVVSNRKLIKIKPERGGQIKYLNPSTRCKQGELLVEFANEFEKASVIKQRALAKSAADAFRRYNTRVSQNSNSASEAEKMKYETDANAAKAELLKAEAELAKTRILAPFSGRIGIYSYGVSEGSHVNPNDTIVNYASEDTDLVVDFFVSESDVPYLKEGKPVTVVAMLYGKQVLIKGKVERINPGADASLSLQARVGLDFGEGTSNLSGPILPGFSVKILCPADVEEMMTTVDERALQELGESFYLNVCLPIEGENLYLVQRKRVEVLSRSGGRVGVKFPVGTKYTNARVLDASKVISKSSAKKEKV